MTDRLSKERRNKLMSRIRSKGTKAEKEFQRKHSRAVPHPDFLPYHSDFALDGSVVFLDSTFWHCLVSKKTYDNLGEFWREKLFRNVVRDEAADSFYGAIGILERVVVCACASSISERN